MAGKLHEAVLRDGYSRTASPTLQWTATTSAIGFSEGPELGRLLRALLDDVVDEPARNDPAWLLERAARELP